MKHLNRILVAVAAIGFATSAFAQDNVVNTPHNLSSTGAVNNFYVADTDEVCVFCHTPHAADISIGVALWNKGPTGAIYTMYSSSTMDMAVALAPANESMACLTCHDGTVAMDTLVNAPGSGNYTLGGANMAWTWTAGTELLTGVANVATDLSNDHPIGITYDNTLDTAFNSIAAVTGAGIRLFTGNTVECASCHNPHEGNLPTFYRVTNAGSAMCTACHMK
ncbi:MAG: cytochrome c3 family protein [Deltaproteobacteria bacterium]|nr:cytochrome c3 family protein [Deltaproteobacteria bacterium]